MSKTEEIKGLANNLKGVYRAVFGKDYEGEVESIVELALLIRNEIKGRDDVPMHLKNRFTRNLQEMGCVDFHFTDEFYKKCV